MTIKEQQSYSLKGPNGQQYDLNYKYSYQFDYHLNDFLGINVIMNNNWCMLPTMSAKLAKQLNKNR